MNDRVIWSPRAESGLAESWLDAANRSDVSTGAASIDRILAQQPFLLGEPHASSVQRIAIVPSLAIIFDIVEEDKKVIVQACWLVG